MLIQILFLTLYACGQSTKSLSNKKEIKIDSVDFIYMKKNQNDQDSVRLNFEQTKMFVDKWNDSKSIGLCKYISEYWVRIILKDGSARTFWINSANIKENNDWTYSTGDSLFIASLWRGQEYSFPRPDQYDPFSFLDAVLRKVKIQTGSFSPGITMVDEFPVNWVKKEHIAKLISIINSKDTCGCFLNPLSSYIPSDYADKGGYAAVFIKAYRDKKPVVFGLYSCPRVNEQLNKELINWWNKEKNK